MNLTAAKSVITFSTLNGGITVVRVEADAKNLKVSTNGFFFNPPPSPRLLLFLFQSRGLRLKDLLIAKQNTSGGTKKEIQREKENSDFLPFRFSPLSLPTVIDTSFSM